MQKVKKKAPRKHVPKRRPQRPVEPDCNQTAFAVLQRAMQKAG
jgi:hypothetical protein